jgi:hypothetical protein
MITRDPVAAPKTGPRRAAGSGPNGSKGLDAGQPNRLTVRTIVASVMPAQPGIHDSYEVSPVKWKFAHLATFPSVFSCCD